jgi:transposase-like protein
LAGLGTDDVYPIVFLDCLVIKVRERWISSASVKRS